jgi:hypothetical protein
MQVIRTCRIFGAISLAHGIEARPLRNLKLEKCRIGVVLRLQQSYGMVILQSQ